MRDNQLVLGYCPVGNGQSIDPFDKVFHHKQDISKSFDGVDAVVFWGGSDIHPSFYGDEAHSTNQSRGNYPSNRDEFEWKAMSYCIVQGIPMIGVCRGAQMLCAKAGGWLIQDVSNHGSAHSVKTKSGEIFGVTSCHHQMMYPFDVPHEMLAWSINNSSNRYEGEKNKDVSSLMKDKVEPEIVFFPEILGLAIQGHPEWAADNSRFVGYTNELIRQYLLETVDVEC